jgi:hypothetical protein
MTRVQASTLQYARRQAIRQIIREQAARDGANVQEGTPPPLREPDGFENALSPEEVKQGVRDGTFRMLGTLQLKRRDMQAGPGGGYVTKGTQAGAGDDDLDEDDTGVRAP